MNYSFNICSVPLCLFSSLGIPIIEMLDFPCLSSISFFPHPFLIFFLLSVLIFMFLIALQTVTIYFVLHNLVFVSEMTSFFYCLCVRAYINVAPPPVLKPSSCKYSKPVIYINVNKNWGLSSLSALKEAFSLQNGTSVAGMALKTPAVS